MVPQRVGDLSFNNMLDTLEPRDKVPELAGSHHPPFGSPNGENHSSTLCVYSIKRPSQQSGTQVPKK